MKEIKGMPIIKKTCIECRNIFIGSITKLRCEKCNKLYRKGYKAGYQAGEKNST